MRLSLVSLLAWTVLAVGAAGIYPTWRFAGGMSGLGAEAAAAGIVVTAMVASAVLIVRQAAGGPAKAAIAFLLTAALRVGICLVLGLAAGLLLPPLSRPAMILWLGAFYLVLLAGESVWLTMAIWKSLKKAPDGDKVPPRLK